VHRVRIYQGDIAKLAVDAVVEVVDERAAQSAEQQPVLGLSGERRGQEIRPPVAQCSVGEVRVIGPDGQDSSKFSNQDWAKIAMVIHTVCPVWRGGDKGEEHRLAQCYRRSMQTAKQENLRSIALPCIGTGIAGFPARRAIKIAVQELRLALQQNPLLEDVTLHCDDPVTAALCRSQIGK